jgi:hypothetical protein
VLHDLAIPDDRGDSVSDQPHDSTPQHEPAPNGPGRTPLTDTAVRAAVLGPTSLMPAVELPDAEAGARPRWTLWAALIVLLVVGVLLTVLLTA